MSRTYSDRWCYICGHDVSAAGAAWVAHCRKHVREGKMIERKVKDRRFPYDHLEFDIVPGVPIKSWAKQKREAHSGG